ncbi:MAG TPA: PQQ-binding-like beta-propeller repeat protein [Pilimelia sp.]|nr:PQQ-binding-like beta-propeller repeat protein [Pilimelia sp.]
MPRDPVVIDLGDVRQAQDPVPEARPGWPGWPGRRRGIGVLLVAVALAVVAGSAPLPALLVERQVPARPADLLGVFDDRLYVIGPNARQPGVANRTIAAYGLPGGQRLWHVALPVTAQIPRLVRVGGVLLLQAYDTEGIELVALDEGTGSVRWRRWASFLGVVPERPSEALGGRNGTVLLGTGAAFAARTLRDRRDVILVVDPRTGGAIWSYRPPPGAHVLPVQASGGDEATRMVTALVSGRVEVRDLATGRLIAAATLREPVAPAADGAAEPWLSADEDLILATGSADPGAVTAYGLERLDRRWTARWTGRWEGTGARVYVVGSACGDLLCLGIGDGDVQAVERETGRVLWHADWLWAAPSGRLLLASSGRGSAETQRLVLLDPATGRTRHEVGRWGLAGRAAGDGWLVVRHDLRTARAWFGLLDPATADVRLLGMVTDVAGDCQAGRHSVVCRRLDMSLGIWRYR